MTAPLLLYDGLCGYCNGWVRFLLKIDRGGSLQFAPLEGETGTSVKAAHPHIATIDSFVFIEGDRVSVRSTAVLRLMRYLGWPWRVLLVGYLVPREIRDSLYDVVAFWRYRLFGRLERCPLPPSEARSRFLP